MKDAKTPRRRDAAPGALAPTAREWLAHRGLSVARLGMLDHAWERLPERPKGWVLEGVQKGVLFVQVRSAAARHDLLLRAPKVLRELNKHFDRPWIKEIRAVQG